MLSLFAKPLARAKSKVAFKLLERDEDAEVRRLVDALKAARHHPEPADELDELAAIERVRERLARSDRVVLQQDFGAGEHRDANGSGAAPQGRLVERRVSDVCRGSSRPRYWCHVIHHIVEEFQPVRALEMGTCFGISGAYIATALRRSGGRLITLEGAAAFAAIAQETFRDLGLENVEIRQGPFSETLERALADLGPVQFVFIDGHHDEDATKAYFGKVLQTAAEQAVILFDDIAWSDGMRRAWNAVRNDPRVRISVDLGPMGVVILGAGKRRRIALGTA